MVRAGYESCEEFVFWIGMVLKMVEMVVQEAERGLHRLRMG